MISLRNIRSIFFLFLVALHATPMAFSQKTSDTIVLSVGAIPPRWPDENWTFNVTFKNLGTDVSLCLGFVPRDGKDYPVNIYFILSNSKGISQELRVRLPDKAPGNMGNDVIKLGAGEEHSIKLGLERLDGWQPFSGNSKFTGTLLPGDYRLHAEFRWGEYDIYGTATKRETKYREKMRLKSDEIAFTVK
jgi:hypothetical protein